MGTISDKWFELTTSIPNLSQEIKTSIQTLRRNEEQYRLSFDNSTVTDAAKGKTILSSVDNSYTTQPTSSSSATDVSVSVGSLEGSSIAGKLNIPRLGLPTTHF
jgi:uncharacterized protein YpmS